MRPATVIATILLTGCAPVTIDLVLPEDWERVPDAEDPFTDLRPDERSCDEAGVRVEEGVLEVDTLLCSWATFRAPLPVDLARNDEVTGLVFHGPLASVEPSEAVIIMAVGDVRVLNQTVNIPSPTALYEPALVLEQEVSGDAWLHIHNHGGNDWRWTNLRVTSSRAAVRALAD